MLATGTVWNWKLFCSVFRPWATLCQCVCFKHCVMQHLSVCQVCVCISFTFHAAFLSVSVCWCQFDATLTFQYIGCAGISVMQQFSIYQVCGHQFHAALAINHLQSITVLGAWVSVSVIRCVNIGFMQHFAVCQVWASVSCSILQSIRCVGISFMPHFSIYQVCGRQFHAAQRLRNHMQSHIEGKNFCCLKCGKLFESQKRLDTHAIIHDAERREPFSCVDCGKVGYWCILL